MSHTPSVKYEAEFSGPLPDSAVSVMSHVIGKLRLIRNDPESLLKEMMSDRNYIVSFVNAHGMNVACNDPDFFNALGSANLLLRDGVGMEILLKAIGLEPGLNMNGTDFIPTVVQAGRKYPIALYGSTAQTAAAAANWLEQSGASRITHCDGFQPLEHYLQLLKIQQPRIVILGMGMPRQELVSAAIARELPGPMLIINGGAILDFMSCRIRRAPRLMRRLGLEWLFRLLLEPARLWRRYLLGNFVFLWHTALLMLHRRAVRA